MMRPRSIGTRSSAACGACCVHEGVEAFGVGRLDVDEIERRRLVRQRRHELPPQIAVDLDHGDEQREAEARATARWSASARPAGGCWRWRAAARSSAACGSRRATAISSSGHQLQRHEHRGRGGDEDRGDLAVVGQRRPRGRPAPRPRAPSPRHSAGAASAARRDLRRGTAPRPARRGRGRAARARRRAP